MSNDKIDEVLGVVEPALTALEIGTPPEIYSEIPYESDENGDIEKDYEYQRENFYKLVELGYVAIAGILELAKEGEHPRAYEVAGQLIKNVAEVTEKLGDLQEKMKKLKDAPGTAPKTVTNALFVGSTAELQKMLKGRA